MTLARITGGQYAGEVDIVKVTDKGDWVLRQSDGGVVILQTPGPLVEVRCDFCGRWSTDAAPFAQGRWDCWMCLSGSGPCPKPIVS